MDTEFVVRFSRVLGALAVVVAVVLAVAWQVDAAASVGYRAAAGHRVAANARTLRREARQFAIPGPFPRSRPRAQGFADAP